MPSKEVLRLEQAFAKAKIRVLELFFSASGKTLDIRGLPCWPASWANASLRSVKSKDLFYIYQPPCILPSYFRGLADPLVWRSPSRLSVKGCSEAATVQDLV